MIEQKFESNFRADNDQVEYLQNQMKFHLKATTPKVNLPPEPKSLAKSNVSMESTTKKTIWMNIRGIVMLMTKMMSTWMSTRGIPSQGSLGDLRKHTVLLSLVLAERKVRGRIKRKHT